MSFILDALKKSENDRQQQSSAEFAGVPTSPPRTSAPRWMWVVGVLLLINLTVLIGLLLRPGTEPPATAASPITESAPPAEAAAAGAPSFEEQVANAKLNRPKQQAAATNSPLADAEEKIPADDLVQPVLISQDPGSVAAADLYPTFQEVRVNGATNLPDLHLDIHVYSGAPDERFVFVNMAKRKEGEQLAEGPRVIEITHDGVVLEHQGQRFLLPRD